MVTQRLLRKTEKDVKEFSLGLKKNLLFLAFSVLSKDPHCNDKWHKKCDTNHGVNPSPVPETCCSLTSTHLYTRKGFSSAINLKGK